MAKTAKTFDGSYDLIVKGGQLITVADSSDKPKHGADLDELGIIENGAVVIRDGRIVMVGTSVEVKDEIERHGGKIAWGKISTIDATGKVILPGLIDPHTHLVYGGNRAHEYKTKIKGEKYEDQTGIGQGILYTMNLTRQATEDELFEKGKRDLEEMVRHGTTAVEIKSGYGLDIETELKMLRTANRLRENMQDKIDIVVSYLGAHAFPPEFASRHKEYRDVVMSMLPRIKEEGLAEFCDVFCDKLAFDPEYSRMIFEEALQHGFKLKIHVDQTADIEGYQILNEMPFVSADHLDYTQLDKLEKPDDFVSVLLPGVTHHLMEMQNTKSFWNIHAREMITRGLAVALSTDYNPGSCPCLNMQEIMKLAACLYRLTPAEIINAATINAAHAIDRAREIGSIEVNKKADIIVMDMSSYLDIVNTFGHNRISTVIKNGNVVYEK